MREFLTFHLPMIILILLLVALGALVVYLFGEMVIAENLKNICENA